MAVSPVVLYAVLIFLCVLVIMGGCLCCGCFHTRVYSQRHMDQLAAMNAADSAHDWGPPPQLFDVYLRPPSEDMAGESGWENIMPISVTRGGIDATDASARAHISVMIAPPFSQPLVPPDPTSESDDERYLPSLEIGLAAVDVRLIDEDALPPSTEKTQ
ncbi:hypothetical protein DFH09DRAFT_1186307 [Mycena vulgaris]|nr:hypothetical protein DFH09DRAFT_1186307 [Mycena vulgaris]